MKKKNYLMNQREGKRMSGRGAKKGKREWKTWQNRFKVNYVDDDIVNGINS